MSTVYPTVPPFHDNLTGKGTARPLSCPTKARIKAFIDRDLSLEILSDRTFELSFHYNASPCHPWQPLDWDAISLEQVIDVSGELFLAAIAVSVEVQTMPIHSRQIWERLPGITPQIASFLGRAIDEEKNWVELGLWEGEERQHSAIFRQVYERLTGEILPVSEDFLFAPATKLKPDRYLFQCVIAKWITTSVYLWLMSHSTGELQAAIARVLQDDIGHLAKFWGILRLRWGDSAPPPLSEDLDRLSQAFCSPQDPKNLSILPSFPLSFDDVEMTEPETDHSDVPLAINACDYLAAILQFSDSYRLEIGFTLLRTLRQIWRWNQSLTAEDLSCLAIVSSDGYFDCTDSTLFVD
ncbi:MAG: hypothetical protein AB4290_10845 [Spirulina sp.]